MIMENKKTKTLMFFLLAFLFGNAFATSENYFDERGVEVIGQYDGDLNADGMDDRILVLANENESNSKEGDDAYYRRIIVLLGVKTGGFKKVAESKKIVLCKSCGGMMGDPFTNVEISPPFFTISHYGGSAWRWSQDITFKYNKKNNEIYLDKISYSTFHASEPNQQKVRVETKKNFGFVPFSKFDVYLKHKIE